MNNQRFDRLISGSEIGITEIRGKAVTVSEIASLLRVSDRWVEMHMSDGTFPFDWFLVGERIRFADSADINEWLQKIKISAGSAPLPKKAIEKIKNEGVNI